ncbi:MAG: hypothetical protein IJS81_09730 [Selenomonadaceae bacterium]|nr:hypothetical protein [Selenomonadaceae bacterium]MBQ7630473.1 hypothetical protein [Selenomonadaceae bacterium]
MIALSNIAQGSAVLGMMYLQLQNAQAQEINVPAWVSCWAGVTSTNTTANAIGAGGVI